MKHYSKSSQSLAAAITRAASKQSYYTVRFLVDRDLVASAYQAYAYFRWLDDQIDQGTMARSERVALVERQRVLVDDCYRGRWPRAVTVEESLLLDLIRSDEENASGLRAYIYNMMAVMAFDAGRRGQLISQEELDQYTRCLATAVTEALHHFIGHDCFSPRGQARYLAPTGAHITHMLRDTLEDTAAGYFNAPREFLESAGIAPQNVATYVGSDPYRAWVRGRVQMARACFQAGQAYLAQVENLRCRLAGYAYIARFQGVLDAIEKDGYRLRTEYPECKRPGAGVKAVRSVISLTLYRRPGEPAPRALPAR